VKAATAFSAS